MSFFCKGVLIYGLVAFFAGGILSHLVVWRFFPKNHESGFGAKALQLVATILIAILIIGLEVLVILRVFAAVC